MAKAEEQAAAHAAKMAKRDAEQAKKDREKMAASQLLGRQEGPKKKTITLIPTKEKIKRAKERKEREAAENAEPDPIAELEKKVWHRENRQPVDFHAARGEIEAFLKQHGGEASLDEVRQAVGIDLLQPSGADISFLQLLLEQPKIEAGNASGERLKYHHPFGVRDRGTLKHVLSHTEPRDDQSTDDAESVLRSQLTASETYDGLDVDLDELLAQGRCVKVPTRPGGSDFAIFAAPHGRPVIEEVRKMWEEHKVPDKQQLKDELLRAKLRTEEEYTARAKRKAEMNKREAELEDPKKNGRTGQIRKRVNDHLDFGKLDGGN